MAVTGTHKAALLLMSLEPGTAAQLLKSAEPTTITKIAAELASLEGQDSGSLVADAPVREFHGLLSRRRGDRGPEAFMRLMLENTLDKRRIDQVLGDVDQMIQLRAPFKAIGEAPVAKLANALRGESAQVVAMVLGELATDTSAALLPLLDEGVRVHAVTGMASNDEVAPEAKLRVAAAIQKRLQSSDAQAAAPAAGQPSAGRDDRSRKVALLIRGLKAAFRDELMDNITATDEVTAKDIQRMMVIWDDIGVITDRSLQEALRSIDSRRLALALVKADPATSDRIRDNISERASSMLDEEISLLSHPKSEEVAAAREAILESLRDLNGEGELRFNENENESEG